MSYKEICYSARSQDRRQLKFVAAFIQKKHPCYFIRIVNKLPRNVHVWTWCDGTTEMCTLTRYVIDALADFYLFGLAPLHSSRETEFFGVLYPLDVSVM
jgi:hypothetical protein